MDGFQPIGKCGSCVALTFCSSLQELLPLPFPWRLWLDLVWERYFSMNLKTLKVIMFVFSLKRQQQTYWELLKSGEQLNYQKNESRTYT